jgi:hypothetical protein
MLFFYQRGFGVELYSLPGLQGERSCLWCDRPDLGEFLMHVSLVLPVEELIRGAEEAVSLPLESSRKLVDLLAIVPQARRYEMSRQKPNDRLIEQNTWIVGHSEYTASLCHLVRKCQFGDVYLRFEEAN